MCTLFLKFLGEIYLQLPLHKDSIMISEYPKYDKTKVFVEEASKVDNKIEFIKAFRNVKAENQISKDAKVLINTSDSIILKTLKLEDVIIDNELDINSYKVKVGDLEAIIYFEKQVTEEELAAKEKQIESLKNSIARRKNLLANENYVNKAPEALVESERAKLVEEEKLLESLVA